MGSTQFGDFHDFCRDSTLPVCNLLSDEHSQSGPWGGCELTGIDLGGGRHLGNLGSIVLAALAILVTAYLLWRSERKQAAVGRREMQLFLLGYIIIEICEIVTVGEFPMSKNVRIAFTGIHLGAIVATTWILLLNALVGYQLVDDGTAASLGLIAASAAALFLGTAYIALDTGYGWSGRFASSYAAPPNRHVALYLLYQLAPLLFLAAFAALEAVLVLRILGERRPMLYLAAAGLLFALAQLFQYLLSPHICAGTRGAVDGAVFETLLTLLAVVMVWVFWSSITEDDWPMPAPTAYT